MDDATREQLVAGAQAEATRLRRAASAMAGLRLVTWEGEAGETFRHRVIEESRAFADAADDVERAAHALAQGR